MKKDIHPEYYTDTTVQCSCGNKFITGSTTQSIITELCSNCHPFFTGKQNLVDTAGTVERFTNRIKAATLKQSQVKEKKPRKARISDTKKLI